MLDNSCAVLYPDDNERIFNFENFCTATLYIHSLEDPFYLNSPALRSFGGLRT